ncbi:hypothetical protein LY76DRAFT_606048 [Colletotrichum caudatum]|nr:hypothetical protein LY76DRAFT_606048 [Colletotrichum caudatum]
MHRHQPNGPSQQHNPGLPRTRRQTQHTSQSPAGQQYNSYQQPAQWRQSEQWNTPAFPTTEAMEDPNGFVDIPDEYQAAENPTTYSQVQDPTSPISMPSRQLVLHRGWDVTHVTALPVVYTRTHPRDKYKWVRDAADGWIGVYFCGAVSPERPQMVVVQEAPNITITQFEVLAKSAHPNMVQLFGLYLSDRTYITYGHVGLDVLELNLTCELEIAAVLSQLLPTIEYLQSLPQRLGIRSIRVSTSGVIKIVAAFLQQVLDRLGINITRWSNDALEFLKVLKAGHQPTSTPHQKDRMP